MIQKTAEAVDKERPGPKITREQRLEIELENRALLERELLEKKHVFASRPYEAQIQFSNVCNMSCIMCHNGANPPFQKMLPEVLRKVGEQLAPSLSVVIPHDGSEPLIVAWDETRHMAEEYGFELSLTTNVQFLDDEKFSELKDITRELLVSIDSHLPELYERIRPGSKPDQVFANLPRAAELCREHGLECWANVVFMTENAPTLPETIAYLTEVGVPTVHVLQMIDVNGQCRKIDPLIHFSSEYVESIKQKCIDVARKKHARLIWAVAGWERYDFRRENKVPAKPWRDWAARWEARMKRHVPGYCMAVWNRVHVAALGQVVPCPYATGGELRLGSLRDQDFDDIWNGTNARDLRRGHQTWDYPALCSTCYFKDAPGPETYLAFVDDVVSELERSRQSIEPTLVVKDPSHMTRTPTAPVIEIEVPEEDIERYVVALSLGGESEHIEVCDLEPSAKDDGIEFVLPQDVWERLRTNLGYWWSIFAVVESEPERVLRSAEIRCLIRHEPIPRVEGSTLRYPDQAAPVADLGGRKQPGFLDRSFLPERPHVVDTRPRVNGTRHRRKDGGQVEPESDQPLTGKEYGELVERIREIAQRALPEEATVLVVSKGDDELLKLDGREAWHFPSGPNGAYIGYNPPDGDWAVEQLELGRARGADHLLIPATSFWWLDHYSSFAQRLNPFPLIVENDSCVIYAFARHPALYGREREEFVRSHQRAVQELVWAEGPIAGSKGPDGRGA